MTSPSLDGERLILIDGHALAYRAYWALQKQGLRTRKEGMPVWAVYGFLRTLLEVIKAQKPHFLAVSFDRPAPTFRHEQFEAYKAQRQPMPEDLRSQMPLIREAVQAFGIPIYEVDGFEADDVIGTIARQARERGNEVLIVTGDQDALQLVDDKIHVLMPKVGAGDMVEMDPAAVQEKYGLMPEQIVDMKALTGDASDNIPGVPGIGPKTALKLLQEHGSVRGLYENLDQVKPPRIQELLRQHQDQAKMSYELATIDRNAPVTLDEMACRLFVPDLNHLVPVLQKFEFSTIMKELPDLMRLFQAEGSLPEVPDMEEGDLWFDFQEEEGPAKPAFAAKIITDPVDLEAVCQAIRQAGRVAVDTETTSIKAMEADLVGISLAYRRSGELETVYLPVGHRNATDPVPQLPLDEVLNHLKPILEDAAIQKVGHHLKYDMDVLSRYGVSVNGLADDTVICDYLVDPGRSHGLKDLALSLLNIKMTPISDLIGTGAKAISMDQVLTEPAAHYAVADAGVTFELAERLPREVKALDMDWLYREVELPLTQVLARMEQHGVRIDTGYLKELSQRMAHQLLGLEQKIHGHAGRAFNVNSPKQLSVILFEEMKLPTTGVKKNPSGGYSTDAQVLEKLAPVHPIVRLLLEYRSLAKLKGTYADTLPELINPRTGLVHTSFNQTVAATGRLSSSDPNLQNIPIKTALGREIRRAFVPTCSDQCLVSADYSQIELRLLAHFSQDEAFVESFQKDEDVHRRTAAEIFGLELSQVTDDMRRIGKTVNFGIAYGQSAYGLAQTLAIPQKEAAGIIERFKLRYPKVQTFLIQTIAKAKQQGYVTTVWGRRRYIPEINSSNRQIREFGERTAINTPIQGTAADIIKLAMVRVDQALKASKLNASLLLQVHDELVFEVAMDQVESLIALIRPIMEGAMELTVPLKVDISSGPNWVEAK